MAYRRRDPSQPVDRPGTISSLATGIGAGGGGFRVTSAATARKNRVKKAGSRKVYLDQEHKDRSMGRHFGAIGGAIAGESKKRSTKSSTKAPTSKTKTSPKRQRKKTHR